MNVLQLTWAKFFLNKVLLTLGLGLSVFLGLVIYPVTALANDSKPIVNIIVPSYVHYSAPPYHWKDTCEPSKVKGATIELAVRAIKSLGFTVTTTPVPVEQYNLEYLPGLLLNDKGLAAFTWQSFGYEGVTQVAESILYASNSVFFRKADVNKYSGVGDLKGKKGLLYTLSNSASLLQSLHPIGFDQLTVSQNVDWMIDELMRDNAVDYLVIEHSVGLSYLAKHGLVTAVVESGLDLKQIIPFYLTFSNESALFPYRDQLAAIFKRQQQSGERTLIFQKNMWDWLADIRRDCKAEKVIH